MDSTPRTLWASPIVLIVLCVLSFAAYFPVAFNAATFNADAATVSHGRDHTHRHRPHARDEGDDITRVLKNGHFYILLVFFLDRVFFHGPITVSCT
jgi:hypothetical protein